MKNALQNLKSQICNFSNGHKLSDSEWEKVAQKTVVALMAGGEGNRFKEVPGSSNTNKNAFKLPNDDTMIEMAIRMYKEVGIKDFTALLYHKSETIEGILGDGSFHEVNINYCYDKGPYGKAGAVKNALETGAIPEDKYFIIHNPDDVILDYEGSFPRDLMTAHIQGEEKGGLCTVAVVEESPYAFTGMKIKDSLVTTVEMYPMVPIPAHIGVTVFSPQIRSYFDEMFDYNRKVDFEKELFPRLSEEKKLFAVSVPIEAWLAVNNLKAYKTLLKRLDLE